MKTITDRDTVERILAHFDALSQLVPLRAIHTEADYDQAVAVLNLLLDAGGANEEHRLAGLVTVLAALIESFEDQTNPAQEVPPAEMLRFLMEQHRLGQADLPEVGSRDEVSAILNGELDLDVRQIKALSARFGLPPGLFLQ
jgi:HTH-type transcriptional regulator/antitoxin HigA